MATDSIYVKMQLTTNDDWNNLVVNTVIKGPPNTSLHFHIVITIDLDNPDENGNVAISEVLDGDYVTDNDGNAGYVLGVVPKTRILFQVTGTNEDGDNISGSDYLSSIQIPTQNVPAPENITVTQGDLLYPDDGEQFINFIPFTSISVEISSSFRWWTYSKFDVVSPSISDNGKSDLLKDNTPVFFPEIADNTTFLDGDVVQVTGQIGMTACGCISYGDRLMGTVTINNPIIAGLSAPNVTVSEVYQNDDMHNAVDITITFPDTTTDGYYEINLKRGGNTIGDRPGAFKAGVLINPITYDNIEVEDGDSFEGFCYAGKKYGTGTFILWGNKANVDIPINIP